MGIPVPRDGADASKIDERLDAALLATQKTSGTSEEQRKANAQVAAAAALAEEATDNSALAIQNRALKVQTNKETKVEKVSKTEESVLIRKEEADSLADEFNKRNPQYRLNTDFLSTLAQDLTITITELSTPVAVIKAIQERMASEGVGSDPAMIDKALEFLQKVASSQVDKAKEGIVRERWLAIRKNLEVAQKEHFVANKAKIEDAAKVLPAVNAVIDGTEFHADGTPVLDATGKPKKEDAIYEMQEVLDRYRTIIHNPPKSVELYKYHEGKGGDWYEKMVRELERLNRYLGTDLKQSHLEPGELANLWSSVKAMQGVTGVFAAAKSEAAVGEKTLEHQQILEK